MTGAACLVAFRQIVLVEYLTTIGSALKPVSVAPGRSGVRFITQPVSQSANPLGNFRRIITEMLHCSFQSKTCWAELYTIGLASKLTEVRRLTYFFFGLSARGVAA